MAIYHTCVAWKLRTADIATDWLRSSMHVPVNLRQSFRGNRASTYRTYHNQHNSIHINVCLCGAALSVWAPAHASANSPMRSYYAVLDVYKKH
jgi:hypothetical protein